MPSLTWDEVRARRLARSHLLEPAPRRSLTEVVGSVCGMQAQIISAAELGLGTRVVGLDRDAVRAELWERRSLVKAYGVRGTLHLLPAAEAPLWAAALRFCDEPPWHERLGFTAAEARAVLDAVGHALDGRTLTREELATEVGRKTGPRAAELLGSGWGSLLGPAAAAGLLCFGPPRGQRVTFVRADQWLGRWREDDPGDAARKVVRRYLAAYGPATHGEFARWFGITPGRAKPLFESLELEPVDVEGHHAWALPGDTEPGASPTASLRLVPQYDAFVIGARPRSELLDERARARVFSYRRGRFEGATALPVVLLDGRVAGIWERRLEGGAVVVRVEAFTRLGKRALGAEAARVAAFLGGEPVLELGALE